MFGKILLATDMYSDSLVICGHMGKLRRVGVKECVLVKIIQAREAIALGVKDNERTLKSSLYKYKRILEKQGIKTKVAVVVGNVFSELNRIIAEEKCRLVVVGSERQSLAGQIFFWNVADLIMGSSSVPVLVMRIKREKEEGPACVACEEWNIKGHVLFPTDFSDNSREAFSWLEKLAKKSVAKITLLHVQDRVKLSPHFDDKIDEFNKIDSRRLRALQAKLKGAKTVKTKIVYGLAGQEIIKYAKEEKADQIVMGSQGRGYIKEIFLGSVSNQVARISPVPVLLVPFNANP